MALTSMAGSPRPHGSRTPKWTVFARAERIETDELALVHDGVVQSPGEVSLGVIRDWRVSEHVLFGVGGLVSHNWTDGLSASYGGDPNGAMGFVRLKIG